MKKQPPSDPGLETVEQTEIAEKKAELGVPRQKERRAATARGALLTDNAQFKAFATSIDYGIIVGSRDSIIVDFNQAALDIFGYTEEELRNAPIATIMPSRFRDQHKAGMQRYNKTQQPKNLGKMLRLFGLHKNGKEFPIELALSTWKDLDGEQYFTASLRCYSALENNLTAILATTAVATVAMATALIYLALNF